MMDHGLKTACDNRRLNNILRTDSPLPTKQCSYKHLFNHEISCPHVVPLENVASISASATVLEGVSRSRNALLNGNTRDYDWESGYTCHQLGSGYIVVQLSQPYTISSMRYSSYPHPRWNLSIPGTLGTA